MSELLRRLITSLVAVAIVIPALIFSPVGAWLFCGIVSMMALLEFFNLMGTYALRYRRVGLGLGFLFWFTALADILLGAKYDLGPVHLAEAIAAVPLLQLSQLYDPAERRPVEQLGKIITGFVYVVLPMFLFLRLSVPVDPSEYSFHFPLGFLLLTWGLDVAAYFSGKWTGKHLLFPRISPKKTWEGAVGGAVFCLFWSWVNSLILPLEEGSWWVIALLIAVFSQWGDLVESMLKRSVKVKDSGGILPGHGGMLDRFDGTFLSVPLVYLYFLLV